ncbi:Gfo/Idh/MocA family oxidoreductase [Streptomyces sp. NPDC048419]|uniref:Gfo/Idh/MocA family protein n=1 Tax=Streptomyces sp. NPDC048419 TaxID=3365547 RepID=UPI003722D73C
MFGGRYWCDYATDPKGPLSWRFEGGPGSGALGDVGSLVIDVAEYVAGPITEVSGAALSTQINKRPLPLGAVVGHNAAPVSDEFGEVENEDTSSFTVRFASGLVGTFSVTRTGFGLPNGLAFDVLGVGGRAAFDQHRPAEYLFDDAQPEAPTRGARQVVAGPQMPYFLLRRRRTDDADHPVGRRLVPHRRGRGHRSARRLIAVGGALLHCVRAPRASRYPSGIVRDQ